MNPDRMRRTPFPDRAENDPIHLRLNALLVDLAGDHAYFRISEQFIYEDQVELVFVVPWLRGEEFALHVRVVSSFLQAPPIDQVSQSNSSDPEVTGEDVSDGGPRRGGGSRD